MLTKEIAETTDFELIDRIQSGNQEAFSMLYDRYALVVYKRVRYKIPESDIDDVVQEVFIGLVKSLISFNGTSQFKTWLRTITDRKIVDFYRQRKEIHQQQMSISTVTEMKLGVMKHGRVMSEDNMHIKDGLMNLPSNYQEILLLRFAEGLPFNLIAIELGLSLEATKSLYRRAVSRLKEELN